jgi:hypothetical protein
MVNITKLLNILSINWIPESDADKNISIIGDEKGGENYVKRKLMFKSSLKSGNACYHSL